MSWLKKKNQPELVLSPSPASRVEIELHKSANREAAQKAKSINDHLNELLVENGFTIKIALAAGRKNIKRQGN